MVAWLESDASFHDVLNAGPLFEQGVNDRSASWDKGSFQEVTQDGEDGVESAGLGLRV